MKAQRSIPRLSAQKLDWSDIPHVLAVCEAGSLAGAARRLGVNHSTVFRRIEAVESRLGVRLFERQSHGYVMTPAGEFFYERAGGLCDVLNEIELELAGQDLRLEGRLRVTTTDSLLHALTPFFAEFQLRHPAVELHVVADARALDLSRRDADIALRPTLNPPEHRVGRRLFEVACATYAQKDHWEHARHQPEAQRRWIMLDDDLDQSPMSRLAVARKAAGAPVTLVSTVMGVFGAVQSGLGIAALPTYLGDRDAGLVRIDAPDPKLNWDVWLLAHPDMRRSARVQAFFEFSKQNAAQVISGGALSGAP
ncbi:MAG: LysR family transcriptional regulator [Pseudomonadota bacterium]